MISNPTRFATSASDHEIATLLTFEPVRDRHRVSVFGTTRALASDQRVLDSTVRFALFSGSGSRRAAGGGAVFSAERIPYNSGRRCANTISLHPSRRSGKSSVW
jgi:hypothetical protein